MTKCVWYFSGSSAEQNAGYNQIRGHIRFIWTKEGNTYSMSMTAPGMPEFPPDSFKLGVEYEQLDTQGKTCKVSNRSDKVLIYKAAHNFHLFDNK